MTENLFSVRGKVVLVTGGNSGIGKTLALALHAGGAIVAIGGRRADRNAAALEALGGPGPNATAYKLDVTDEVEIERTIVGIIERFGRLDVLINNAGDVNRASVMHMERGAWDRVLAINLTGAFLCSKHAARAMERQGAGKIINIASIWGLIAPSKGLQAAYTASKHGLIGLTRANAVELAPLGIQVNAIAPGYYFTEMTAELRGTPFEQTIRNRTPSGRLAETEELVGTCLYLASAASNNVVGQCIVVDGGYLASDGLDRG